MVWNYLWDPFDDFDDIFYQIGHMLIDHDLDYMSDEDFYDCSSDSISDSSDDCPFMLAALSPEKKKSRQDRRRRTKEQQATRQARLLLATVYQQSKDESSYLSRLPHEIVSLILSYCNCSDNDLRLMSQGFDYVGMTVTVPLPLSRSKVDVMIGGVVTNYDVDCDEHQLCLINGERVVVQINGIGKNGCHVQFSENSDPSCDISFPSSPNEITRDWIQQILNYSSNFNYNIQPVATDTGNTCQACSIHVQPEDPVEAGLDLFVKFPLPHSTVTENIWQSGCYQREAYFYSSLLENTPTSLLPFVYCVHCDFAQRQSVIVLQDMRKFGDVVDASNGFSSLHVAKVLQSLALLHASWWNSPFLAKYFAESSLGHHRHITFTPLHSLSKHLSTALSLLKEHLPESHRKEADYLLQNIQFIYIRFAQRPLTLCHCDIRPDHTFIQRSPPHHAVFVDWQRCGPAVAIRDVTTVLAGANHEDTRGEVWYREAVEYYTTELSRCVRGYALASDCYADFRVYTLLYMSELVVALRRAQQDKRDARHVSYIETTLKRVIQTAITVKAFDLLRTYVDTTNLLSPSVGGTPPPTCRHGEPAVLRRMLSGVKQGQLFYSCPRYEIGKECSFFMWTSGMGRVLQSGTPYCIVHEKFTEVRYSLLPEKLGNRYFSCAEYENPCKFFKWVVDGTIPERNASKPSSGHGQVLCRNWAQSGHCRFGSSCHFKASHTPANRLMTAKGRGEKPAEGVGRGRGRYFVSAYPRRQDERKAQAVDDGRKDRTGPSLGPKCRYWAKSRSCPYGEGCYFSYSHT